MASLDESIDSLCYEAAFSTEALENPDIDIDELADVAVETSATFRTLAIALLLARANTDGFYHNLIRSGLARLAFLTRAADEQRLDHPDAGAGYFEGLLDAIAGGDLGVARGILGAARPDFVAGTEYEDDWCYARLLGWLLTREEADAESGALLDRLLAFLDGSANGRWLVCKALVDRSEEGFAAAMTRLLEERAQELSEDEERGQIEDIAAMSRRHIFVEGLAILRLAKVRGLETNTDYPGCPSLARVAMVRVFPGE